MLAAKLTLSSMWSVDLIACFSFLFFFLLLFRTVWLPWVDSDGLVAEQNRSLAVKGLEELCEFM